MSPFKATRSSSICGKNPLSSSSNLDEGYVYVRHKERAKVVPDRVEYVQAQGLATANEHFRSRDDVLEEMDKVLLPPKIQSGMLRPRVYNICGPAGIGKTQTALHFFHSRKSEFDVVLWVQAHSEDSLHVAFRQIASKLGLETQDSSDDVVFREQVKGWLAEPFQQFSNQCGKLMTWLLVFDNADNLENILQFWSFNGQGSVIVTSRDPLAQSKNYFGEVGTTLGCLSEEDAVALLKLRLEYGAHQHVESEQTYLEVARALECWPLAIVQVCGIIARRKLTLSNFLEEYRGLLERAEYHRTKAGIQHGYLVTLTANWALEGLLPEAARILSVISLLHPTAIQEGILISLPEKAGLPDYPQSQSAYSKALRQLESSSIITRRSATGIEPAELSIHPFIQDVVRGQLLTTDIGIVAVFNATVRLLTAIWPFETLPSHGYQEVNKLARRAICDRNLPHINSLRRIYDSLPIHARQSCANEDFLNLLSEMGWVYYQRFNPEEAYDYIQATLAVHEDCVGEKHPRIIAAQYGTWNAIAKEINDPKLAMETGMKSLAIREQLYTESGIPDSQIVASYASAGLTYLMNGRDDEAEQFVNRSMTFRKQIPNFSRLQLYSPLVYLSLIYLYRGKCEDAANYLLEALGDRTLKYGVDDHESMRQVSHTGTILAYLGKVRTFQGRFEEGLKYYERAFHSWCAAGGKHDYSMGRLYYWLAIHYFRTKSLETAATLLIQAIEIFSRSGYHQYEHARCLFLKSQCLRTSPENEEASVEALTESAALRRGYCGDNFVAMENLELMHFDEYVALWNR